MIRICKICGKEFATKHSTRNFCSEECKIIRDSVSNRICKMCGTEFIPNKINKNYCSEECKIIGKKTVASNWLKYNKEYTYEQKRLKRESKQKIIKQVNSCVICGKDIIPPNKYKTPLTCSEECKKKRVNDKVKKWRNTPKGIEGYADFKIKRRLKDRENYVKNKIFFIKEKGNICNHCGRVDIPISCFEFHHENPNDKKYSITPLLAKKISTELIEEMKKCILLCSFCHRIHHSGNEKVSDF